jgi:hypothetical protein
MAQVRTSWTHFPAKLHAMRFVALIITVGCALTLFIRTITTTPDACDPCQVLGVLDNRDFLYLYDCPNSTIELRKFDDRVGDNYTGFKLRVADVAALVHHLVRYNYEKNAAGPLWQPSTPNQHRE